MGRTHLHSIGTGSATWRRSEYLRSRTLIQNIFDGRSSGVWTCLSFFTLMTGVIKDCEWQFINNVVAPLILFRTDVRLVRWLSTSHHAVIRPVPFTPRPRPTQRVDCPEPEAEPGPCGCKTQWRRRLAISRHCVRRPVTVPVTLAYYSVHMMGGNSQDEHRPETERWNQR